MPAIKPVSYQRLIKIFEQEGFTFDRQRGDHLTYTKRTGVGPGRVHSTDVPRVAGLFRFHQ